MSITTQEKIGDEVAAAVVAIIGEDGTAFPFKAYGPRSTEGIQPQQARCEVRAGGFVRASDQMALNPQGKWFYAHRRGFVTATIVSQRQAQTQVGPDTRHAEAVGRIRYLLSNVTQLLTPDKINGYQVVDIIDQGDGYVADQEKRQDRTEVRFEMVLWLNPATYTGS